MRNLSSEYWLKIYEKNNFTINVNDFIVVLFVT